MARANAEQVLTCVLGAKCSTGIIRYYELFKTGWFAAIKDFVGEEENFKLYPGFHREPMQRS